MNLSPFKKHNSNIGKSLLVISVLCVALVFRLALALLPDSLGDITTYRSWAERVDKNGIHDSYFQDVNPSIDYPPIIPYILGTTHKFYQKFDFSFFEKWFDPLNFLIRIPAAIADMIISIILFVLVRQRSSFKAAFWVMLIYAFNPAIMLNTAYWGQTDAIHTLLLLLGIICLVHNQPELSWGFVTLGIFTKPLTWPFIPLILFLTIRDYRWVRLPTCMLLASVTAAIVLFPFIHQQAFFKIITRIVADLHLMPFISVNAHNIWWLSSFGPPWVPASKQLFQIVSFQSIGIILFGVFYLYIFLNFSKVKDRETDYLVAFSVALAFFMVATHLHENHLFAVFPLLAMICLKDRRLSWVYGILSMTFLANIILHDPLIMIEYFYDIPFHIDLIDQFYEPDFIAPSHRLMTIVNSLVNTVVFGYLIFYLFVRKYWRISTMHKY